MHKSITAEGVIVTVSDARGDADSALMFNRGDGGPVKNVLTNLHSQPSQSVPRERSQRPCRDSSSPPHSRERQPLIRRRFRPVTIGGELIGMCHCLAVSAMRSTLTSLLAPLCQILSRSVRQPGHDKLAGPHLAGHVGMARVLWFSSQLYECTTRTAGLKSGGFGQWANESPPKAGEQNAWQDGRPGNTHCAETPQNGCIHTVWTQIE